MGRRTVIVLVGTAIAAAFWIWSLVEFSTHRSYKQPSESMEPTIGVNDRVLVDEDAYDGAEPEINDIVLFHPPRGAVKGATQCGVPRPRDQACPEPTPEEDDNTKFIKRIVSLPGDTLSIQGGRPVVNGQLAEENFIEPCRGSACDLPRQITIPADHFFLLGDNRGASDDSRFWGPVPRDYLIGKVTSVGGLRSLTRIPPAMALALLIAFIVALVVAGMKRRWVFFGIGFFLFPVAVCGALLEARPGSYWAKRWGSPEPS